MSKKAKFKFGDKVHHVSTGVHAVIIRIKPNGNDIAVFGKSGQSYWTTPEFIKRGWPKKKGGKRG